MRILITLLCKMAAVLLFLHFLGGLSWTASIALSFLIPLDWTGSAPASKSAFRAHQIYFTPHVGKMLVLLGLMSDADWKEHIQKPYEPDGRWSCERLLRWGVQAVAIAVDPDGNDTVHWLGPNFYTESIGYQEDLAFLQLPGRHFPWSPSFFIRPGNGGYHLGLRVSDEWWQDNQSRVEALGLVKSQDREWNFGTTRLTFEILPAKVFWPFYNGWSQKLVDDAAKSASALGWKNSRAGGADIGYFGEIYSSKFADIRVSSLHSGY